MAYFNLPFGIRISNSEPLDGDRYIAANEAAKNLLITNSRSYEGLQVYQVNTKKLYLLTGSTSSDWMEVGSGGGISGDFLALSGGTMLNTNLVTNLNANFLSGRTSDYFQSASGMTDYSLSTHTHSIYLALAGGTLTGWLYGTTIDITGKITASNIETNNVSYTTRLGVGSGHNEDETGERRNIFIGYNAGYSTSTATDNIFIGLQSAIMNSIGSQNIFIGRATGWSNDGNSNVFIGYQSGYYNTGSNSVFIGSQAGMNEVGGNKLYISNTITSNPLIYGEFDNSILKINGSLYVSTMTNSVTTSLVYYNTNTSGLTYGAIPSATPAGSNTQVQYNTGGTFGASSNLTFNGTDLSVYGSITGRDLEANSATTQSTRLGYQSGHFEDSGGTRYNIFIGYFAGYTNTTGNRNTYVGISAGFNGNVAQWNTFIGSRAGYSNISGQQNTYVGIQAGQASTGSNNTYIGGMSANNNVTGSGNVFIGNESGKYETGSNTLIIDNQDRYYENTGRTYCLVYGTFASTPSNQFLTVNGYFGALNIETNPTSLTTRLGIGAGSGEAETSIRRNVFIGYQAGISTIAQADNTYIGYQAGYTANAGQNVHIGSYCGKLQTGGLNVFIGYDTANVSSSSSYNTIVGWGAGKGLASVGENTFIGYQAGAVYAGGTSIMIGNGVGRIQTAGSANVYIGNESAYSNVNGQTNIFIGYRAGYYETGSNKLFIDNQIRSSEVGSRNNSLIYGEFSSTLTNQLLKINGNLYVSGMTNGATTYMVYYDTGTTKLTYGTFSGGGGGSVLLAKFYTDSSTVGTSNTDLYTYNMPSGTLTTDGDTIEANFTLYGTVTTGSVDFAFYTNGASSSMTFNGTSGINKVNVKIVRVSSSTVRITTSFIPWLYYEANTIYTEVTGLNLSTTGYDLILSGTASTGYIMAKMGYILKI